MRHWLAPLYAAASLFSASALAQDNWQKQWEDTKARARGKTLVISVHAIRGHAETVNEFQKRFPEIRVQLTQQNPSQAAPRIIAEQRNGIFNWDVWWAATSNMTTVGQPAGIIVPITDYLILPEVKNLENWRTPDFIYASKKGSFVFAHAHLAEGTVFINRANAGGVSIRTVDDLLDPRLRGKIVMRDPSRPNAGTFNLATFLVAKDAAFLEKFLNEMDPVVMVNPRQVTDAVMRGDAAVAIGAGQDVVAQCRKQGGCAQVEQFVPGAYVLSRGVSVFKNAPNPDAAKVFVNWFLSKEGQEVYVAEWGKLNNTGALSLRKDVEPHPEHAESVPDYANLGKSFMAAFESAEETLLKVREVYEKHRNKPR